MRALQSAFLAIGLLACSVASLAQWQGPSGDQGFLDRPPVYVNNEPDFPLTGLGGSMPGPGELIPDVDLSGVRSDSFNEDGNNVQPGCSLRINWIRVGAMRGFNGGWAAGFSIPYYRNLVKGSIGGQPATSIAQGFGGVTLGGKKILWEDKCRYSRVAMAVGVELPTGKDNAIFNQANFVTNGYYTGASQRIPLGWQPGTGTWNGLCSLSYTNSRGRLSYEGLLAAKVFGTDGQDVKVGNILIASAQGTYGLSRDLAGSLGLTLRTQGDDSYPDAPVFPGIHSAALAGTTTHSTTLYLDAGVRYVAMNMVTVGVGIRTPINTPSQGMVPDTQVSIIFYPSMR